MQPPGWTVITAASKPKTASGDGNAQIQGAEKMASRGGSLLRVSRTANTMRMATAPT